MAIYIIIGELFYDLEVIIENNHILMIKSGNIYIYLMTDACNGHDHYEARP